MNEEATKNCPPGHIWFYWEGWRVGRIVKKRSENLMTVQDVTGLRHQVELTVKENWVSRRHKDFKGQKTKLKKKERKNDNDKGKEKKKRDGKKRIKSKATKRKLRKGKKLRIRRKKTD